MNCRNLLLVLIIAVCMSSTIVSQPRGNRVEMQLKRINDKVELTKEQTVKVKDLLQKAQDEIRAQFENGDGDREGRREAIMKQTEKTDAEIIKLLTKEQKVKFVEYKKERQKEMQERMKDRN